jgi:hypothetical protein
MYSTCSVNVNNVLIICIELMVILQSLQDKIVMTTAFQSL